MPKDIETAIKYYQQAAVAGYGDAVEVLKRLGVPFE